MKIDPTSATWINIKKHLDGRASEIRAKLESDVPWETTSALRAGLREIKTILSLAEPEEAPLVDQDFELPS